MSEDELLELRHEPGTGSELELGCDPLLDRLEVPLPERSGLGVAEALEREILERCAAPQCERGAQQLDASRRRRRLRFCDEPFEPREIERLRVDAQHVARGIVPDSLGADRLPETRDRVLERRGCRPRCRFAPELVDQTIARDGLVRVQQQVREQCAREPPLQPEAAAVVDHLERSEDPKLHVTFVALSPSGR